MITFPWNNQTAPNVMIDIIDKCNIKCDVCYQKHSGKVKSVGEVMHEVRTAEKLRDLHMVTITGGEPTLHPQLLEIVSQIRSRGHLTSMTTNGILLDTSFLKKLNAAGLGGVLFHVDTGQKRPDLPKNAGLKDIRKRLYELTDTATALKMNVSFSWILFDFAENELDFVLDMFLRKPDISMLFLSKGVDPVTLPESDFDTGWIAAKTMNEMDVEATQSRQRIEHYFRKKLDLHFFSSIPAVTARGQRISQASFVTYFLPLIYLLNRVEWIFPIRSNTFDRMMMYLPRLLQGRFMYKATQNTRLTSLRVLCNGLSRLRVDQLFRFFRLARKKDRVIRSKTIIYDDGPYILPDGSMAVCEYCPTAIIKNDRLVRCCEIYRN